MAAPARTVTAGWPAVAAKSDVRACHDIAYVTLNTAWSAESQEQLSYEPEPDMPEATAEI